MATALEVRQFRRHRDRPHWRAAAEHRLAVWLLPLAHLDWGFLKLAMREGESLPYRHG